LTSSILLILVITTAQVIQLLTVVTKMLPTDKIMESLHVSFSGKKTVS